MSIVEWNEETKKEIQDMINEGITSFKLYMTYPAMIVDDEDLYKIIKALNEKGCFAGVHCENAGVIDALTRKRKHRENWVRRIILLYVRIPWKPRQYTVFL